MNNVDIFTEIITLITYIAINFTFRVSSYSKFNVNNKMYFSSKTACVYFLSTV